MTTISHTAGVACLGLLLLSPLYGDENKARGMDIPARMQAAATLVRDHAWFRRQRDEILDRCEPWLERSAEELWMSIPDQCIPRVFTVSQKHGCPACGPAVNTGYGYYPWRSTPEHPWKVQCPKCRERFPKNDFWAYYCSGMDARGRFDEARADRKLLVNPDHPDPNDPKHTYGVDPGTGYRSEEGAVHAFVACYNGVRIWGFPWSRDGITSVTLDLAYAYLLTGDVRYARKAAVILGRIAVLYPDMDYRFWMDKPEYNPNGLRLTGKILDRIWDNFLIKRLLRAYALVAPAMRNDPVFAAFLESKAGHLPVPRSVGASLLESLVEQNYLRAIFRCAQNGVLWGNTGMTEECVALVALVTVDPAFKKKVLDWLFEPRKITGYNTDAHQLHGGGLLDLTFSLSRDGFSWESGGYCEILPEALTAVYPVLAQLAGPAGDPTRDAALELCRRRLTAYSRNHFALICLDRFKPNWGDNGVFCLPYFPKGPAPTPYFNSMLTFGDERAAAMTKAALEAGNMTMDEALGIDDLFSVTPETADRLKMLAAAEPATIDASANLTGRGLVLLKQGSGDHARCLWTHYGNNWDCHNHPDTLALGLFAFGMDILPRLGYPNLRDRNSHRNWYLSAVSTNTVVVDGQEGMRRSMIADQRLYAQSELVSLFAVDAGSVYPEARRYRRCAGLVRISDRDFYVVDFFDIDGGREHVYIFHSGAGEVTPDAGLVLSEQATGTYAGPDVEYADEDYRYSENYGWRWGNGFQFLYDVKRSGPAEHASFVWALQNTHGASPLGDTVRCRLNLLTPMAEIALAKGKPPQQRKGNAESITYVLAARRGDADLATHVVSVIEAYVAGERAVASVSRLKQLEGGPFCSAVAVTFADGRRDLIVKGPDQDAEAVYEGGLRMKGSFCLLRQDANLRVTEYHASEVREISVGNDFHMTFVPSASGRVIDFETDVLKTPAVQLAAQIEVPANVLTPLWADIVPAAEDTDGSYRVLEVSVGDAETRLVLDTDSFAVGLNSGSEAPGNAQLRRAFNYAFATGAILTIPYSYHGRPD